MDQRLFSKYQKPAAATIRPRESGELLDYFPSI
jgi:hypothetical protein